MNYIYDITLNLNNNLIDFFDWNKCDKLMHIKKMPIFKISEENLKNLTAFCVKFSEEFVKCVHNKTEIWNIATTPHFCALFCDDSNVIGIEFDEFGKSIKKSSLLVDEELDVLEVSRKLEEKDIDYEKLYKENVSFETRKEINEKKFIDNELRKIDTKKLEYIYFECYGKKEKKKKTILNEFKSLNKNSKVYENLYNILKLTSTTKK